MNENQIAYLKYFTSFFGNPVPDQKTNTSPEKKNEHGWY